MSRFYWYLYFVCMFGYQLHAQIVQPYVVLEQLQIDTVKTVCEQFNVIPDGVSSSCFTAIRNLYWSFKSKMPIYEEDAHELACNIMLCIYDFINNEEGIDIIKISDKIDADFLHVVVFFEYPGGAGEGSVDIVKGWSITQLYNYYGNGSILKIVRPLEEVLSKIRVTDAELLMPSYACFVNKPVFNSHLLKAQPFAKMFNNLSNNICDSLESIPVLCNVEMEDRSSNAIDSSFEKVRKLFFYAEWDISDDEFTYDSVRSLFVKSIKIILDSVNSDMNVRPYLSTYPFTVDNIEFVLRSKGLSSVNNLSSVYNIKNNIIYITSSSECGIGAVALCEDFNELTKTRE